MFHVSAGELSQKAGAAAALLQSGGAVAGRAVAAVTASSPALCVLARACAVLGVPLLPIDPALPDTAITDLLAQTGAGIVVGERAPAGYPRIEAGAILACRDGAPPDSRLAPQGIALMLATSGSSGRPKAVMLTARNLHAAALAAAAVTPLGPRDRWLACLPLFHIGGQAILTRCALAGADAVLHQGFDAGRVWQAIQTGRITHLSLVPAMLAQLLELATVSPAPTLRHVLVGGAALSSALAGRAVRHGWPIQPTYGMSETASQIATLPRLTLPWRTGQVGKPLPGIDLAVDADGRLKVRGPMVMAGYANPELRPGDGLDDGWFVTNDLAEIDAAGELVILGRADEVIVSGGKKIHPVLVENALMGCPGVTAVGVAGCRDDVWGEVVTAVFVGEPSAADLLDWARAHVAGALRPRAARRVDALPLLSNGKPDRLALRKLADGPQTQAGRSAELPHSAR